MYIMLSSYLRTITSKKNLRKQTGVTEKGGQFDKLNYFKKPG